MSARAVTTGLMAAVLAIAGMLGLTPCGAEPCVDGPCPPESVKVNYWFPLEFKYGYQCIGVDRGQMLEDRAPRLSCKPYGWQDLSGSGGMPFTTFLDSLTSADDLIIISEGFVDASFVVNAFRWAALRDSMWTAMGAANAGYRKGTLDGLYTIEILGSTIASDIVPKLKADTSLVVMLSNYSYGEMAKYYWGVPTIPGRTLSGFASRVDSYCVDPTRFINHVTCGVYAGEEPFLDQLWQARVYGMSTTGNVERGLNPHRDCWCWQTMIAAQATPDSIRWQVRDGHAGATYMVRWFESGGGAADTVAVVQSAGDGRGLWCGYATPHNSQAGYCEVLEIRDEWVDASSGTFEIDDTTTAWRPVSTGDCVEATIGLRDTPADTVQHFEGDSVVSIAVSELDERTGDEWCGHVVTWMNTDQFAFSEWENTVRPHVERYQTEHLDFYRIQGWGAPGNDPSGAEEIYDRVAAANTAYNASHPLEWPYPDHPLLLIIGTDVLPTSKWGDPGICPLGQCLSYSLITDTDDDGRPDGPVTWIPSKAIDGLATPCNSADEFNSGEYRNPAGAVAVFLGDCFNQTTCNSQWQAQRIEMLTGRYGENGRPIRGVLRETALSSGWAEAGRACLESGVSDLWIQGLQTNEERLTKFLSPPGYPVSTNQRIMVFAPTCNSLDLWTGGYEDVHLRKMMFPTYYGGSTLVAGAIGCIAAGWSAQHDLFRDLLAYHMGQAENGTLYAEIAKRVADDLYEFDPDYARSIVTMGGILKYPSGMAISDVAIQADRPGTRLHWIRNGTGGRFEYELEGMWDVTLDIFDVTGRRITTVESGIRAGKVVTSWVPDRIPNGLYFGRLKATRGGEAHLSSTKVLLLR
jgi:hypothetical protein